MKLNKEIKKHNLNKLCTDIFKSLSNEIISITPFITRYAYDDSDYTGWVLFFGEDSYDKINDFKEKLSKYTFDDKPAFRFTGNGYGTGISVTINLN